MAAYDPKRPRPSASTPADDPAPVEALLDPTEPPTVEVPIVEVPVVESPAVESPAVESPAVESTAVESPTGPDPVETPTSVGTAADATSPAGERDRAVLPDDDTEVAMEDGDDSPAEPDEIPGIALNGAASNGSSVPPSGPAVSGRTASEVPVAPAPASGTANRAVLIAGAVSSIVAALVLILLLRRRRR